MNSLTTEEKAEIAKTHPGLAKWAGYDAAKPDDTPLVRLGDVKQWLKPGDRFSNHDSARVWVVDRIEDAPHDFNGPDTNFWAHVEGEETKESGLAHNGSKVRLISPRWERMKTGDITRPTDVLCDLDGIWERKGSLDCPVLPTEMFYRLTRSRLATRADVRVGMRVRGLVDWGRSGATYEGVVTSAGPEHFSVGKWSPHRDTTKKSRLPVEILEEAPSEILPRKVSANELLQGDRYYLPSIEPYVYFLVTQPHVDGEGGWDRQAFPDGTFGPPSGLVHSSRSVVLVSRDNPIPGDVVGRDVVHRDVKPESAPDPHSAIREQFRFICDRVDWELVAEIHEQREWASGFKPGALAIELRIWATEAFERALCHGKWGDHVPGHALVVLQPKSADRPVELYIEALNSAAYKAKCEELWPTVKTEPTHEPTGRCNRCNKLAGYGLVFVQKTRLCGDCNGIQDAEAKGYDDRLQARAKLHRLEPRHAETEPPPSPHDWPRGWASPSWEE